MISLVIVISSTIRPFLSLEHHVSMKVSVLTVCLVYLEIAVRTDVDRGKVFGVTQSLLLGAFGFVI